MSQIIVLNDRLNHKSKDIYFYCLDSHGEYCFTLEYKGEIIYCQIYGGMNIWDKSKLSKTYKKYIDNAKDVIDSLFESDDY